jgi:hypothetical protein
MGAHSWNIIRKKGKGLKVEIPIDKSEWESIVEDDPSLTWMDDTPTGIEFYQGFGKDKPKKTSAWFEFDEKNQKATMTMQFATLYGYIMVQVGSITPKKARKVFEIADKLDSKVYKLGREITKEKAFSKCSAQTGGFSKTTQKK